MADEPTNQPNEHKRRPRRKRPASQEIAHDIMSDFDDLPDAAFFGLAEELDIELEGLDDDR